MKIVLIVFFIERNNVEVNLTLFNSLFLKFGLESGHYESMVRENYADGKTSMSKCSDRL